MSSGRRIRAIVCCFVLTGAVLVPSDPAGGAFYGDNGRIVFESEREGNLEVYAMNPDGSGQVNLSNNNDDDYNPVWSPDGSKIAFGSYRDGNDEIYVMNADGSGQTRLTNNPADDYEATWSPDGTKIAFETERHAESCPPNPETWRCNEIYVMNADGSAQTRLTDNTAGDYDAHWSPDGTQIVHESERDGNFEIYVMNADGSAQTSVSNHPSDDTDPLWSPDGSKIAFETFRDGNDEIYVMNADGTGQTNLTKNTADDNLADCCYPRQSWSPDGTRIAFQSDRDGNDEVYVMNADGTSQSRLTTNTLGDYDPTWSPDGTMIAFESGRDSDFEIYVMNADGSGQARLTDSPGGDWEPEWSSAIDDASPETTIVSGPKPKTTGRAAKFTFTASEIGSAFRCKLDAQAFKACRSPKKYKGLAPGKHTFSVVATDPAGNADPTAAKRSWKISN